MENRTFQGINPRTRNEDERIRPERAPVIKAVTNVTTSNVTLWTVTANKFMFINDFSVCNIAGVTIAITVYLVPEGGSASTTNKMYNDYAVLPNDSGTLTVLAGDTLLPGDMIIAVTDNATGANFRLDGIEFVGGLPNVG